jgi:gas vesicle protein
LRRWRSALVGVGAAAALLLAPHNGEKTRERVASAMGEGVKRGRDLTEDVWEQLNAEFPNVRARFEELASKAINK